MTTLLLLALLAQPAPAPATHATAPDNRHGTNVDTPARPVAPFTPAKGWHRLGGAHAAYYGYGAKGAAGNVLVEWHCAVGSRDVRPGPAPTPATAQPYVLPDRLPNPYDPWHGVRYAPSPCASGRCPR